MKVAFVSFCALFFSIAAFAHPGHGGHLKFAGGAIHAHLAWDQGPDGQGGESKMRLEWHDGETHALIEPEFPFQVSLWMPSMGHGSAPTQLQRVLNERGDVVTGTYLVSNMYFIMPGQWDVVVKVKYPNGTEEAQSWSVEIEGGDHGGHHH